MLAFPPWVCLVNIKGFFFGGATGYLGPCPMWVIGAGRADWPRALNRGRGGMNRSKKDGCLTALCPEFSLIWGGWSNICKGPFGEMFSPTLTVLLGGEVTRIRVDC